MNILFSTTRQWNPGDEFIHRGIQALFRLRGMKFNSIAWNRHPAIRPSNVRGDNSFDENRHDPRSVDYVVFAGSPEWRGSPRTDPLYQLIATGGARCSLIGIGTSELVPLSPLERLVLEEHSDLVACRDRPSWDQINNEVPRANAQLIACPSIFSAATTRVRERLRRVGVIYQTTHTVCHKTSVEARNALIRLIDLLTPHCEVVVMSNYVDEWAESSVLFGSNRVWYSHESRDYEDAFLDLDCVIGARVHSCMGAMSTGAVGVLIDWEGNIRRTGLADQVPVMLKAPTNDPEATVRMLLELDVREQSKQILDWRGRLSASYMELLDQAGVPMVKASTGVPVAGREDVLKANELAIHRLDTPKPSFGGELRRVYYGVKRRLIRS